MRIFVLDNDADPQRPARSDAVDRRLNTIPCNTDRPKRLASAKM